MVKESESEIIVSFFIFSRCDYICQGGCHTGYKEDGVTKYRILATLDMKTSDKCRGMDGKEFDVKDAVVGVNYWPFHPHCRTTDVPVYEDDDLSEETRVARDSVTGKTYEVPADMTYEQWHKKHIEGNPEGLLEEKKWKNRLGDKKQYEDYKEKLGSKYLPKSFDEFQNIKHGARDEYGILKAQAKGITYYNKAVANEPEITEHLKGVANTVGMDCVGLEHRIKSEERYLEKIRRKYNPDGNEYEVKDILRYTYTASPLELSEKTLKSIDTYDGMGYNTVEIKNSWLNNLDPYKGINTTIQSTSGQKFELQYHTPDSFKIKDSEMHKLYEKQQAITDVTSKEYIDLTNQMFALSDKLEVPVNISEVKNR